jgi:putative flippase GtrA
MTTFLRFGCVGAANTVLTLVTFAVLTRTGVVADAASALAFGAGALNGYLLNRSWTFKAPGSVARYIPVQALGALTSAGLHHFVAECLVIPPVTLLTYLLSRRFVFRPTIRRSDEGPEPRMATSLEAEPCARAS